MKNTKENVLNLQSLESKLGVKMTKAKRNTTKLSLKAQITHKVNEKIHELLCNEFSEYYKEIETDAITNCKGETQIQKIRGYRLMIPKSVAVGNEEHEGLAIGKPTLYVDGINTTDCVYFKEVGNTTTKK